MRGDNPFNVYLTHKINMKNLYINPLTLIDVVEPEKMVLQGLSFHEGGEDPNSGGKTPGGHQIPGRLYS